MEGLFKELEALIKLEEEAVSKWSEKKQAEWRYRKLLEKQFLMYGVRAEVEYCEEKGYPVIKWGKHVEEKGGYEKWLDEQLKK